MSRIVYDNWERLVVATLRREQLWELFHSHSRTPSVSSTGSDFSFSSPLPGLFFDFSSPSSWYQQNSVRETHIRGYKANNLEVANVLKAEKSHQVKQLAPGDIFVNGKALTSRELVMLQSCQYPPKKLTPGNYWYDRNSGFWGKVKSICFLPVMQGRKPSQISAQLDIGGRLEQHASNGNTLVFVNGREITRAELRDADASDENCIYSCSPRMKALSDWLLSVKASSSSDVFSAAFIKSSAPLLKELWSDPATHSWIFSNILGLVLLFFRYQLIRSTSNRVEDNDKLLEKFEDVQMVVFCISLSDYDEFVIDENGVSVNKMMHDRKCFESMVTNPLFYQTPFLLLLTKYDLFEQKIEHVPLDKCDWFNDFLPGRSAYSYSRLGKTDMAEKGFYYISVKFKDLYNTLTGGKKVVRRESGLFGTGEHRCST
ncbi:UNVERIFIED_CONTAM: Extra-large guanine nucleotide-binding protein 1 [Sesamum latifolium]|uniref:Extra-large guanine nucleotide-binding protein 1 n=1 Tax=Sesamum latifolium TaxID=2727402 RepID=A0AAW2Y6X7_9LAMI